MGKLSFRIVLVEPEHPHNVGFVARAMHCNAIPELYIVYPRRETVNPESYRTAHNSAEILDGAKVVHTLDEALATANFAIAFSRRRFDTVMPHTSLPNLSEKLPAEGNVALVFGRESCGLSLEEIERCAMICEIPVPGQMSLNLAQAVSVACYELCRSGLLENSGLRTDRVPLKRGRVEKANLGQIESFMQYLRNNLTDRYRHNAWTESAVREFLQRLAPTRFEMSALLGLVKSLVMRGKEDARRYLKENLANAPKENSVQINDSDSEKER